MSKGLPVLNDIGAERAVLAGIIAGGANALIDVEELLGVSDFYGQHHQRLFAALRHLVHDQMATAFDVPSIQTALKFLGHESLIDGTSKDQDYLASLFLQPVCGETSLSLATMVYKLSLARRAFLATKEIQTNLLKLKGEEPLSDLLAMIEEPIFSFTTAAMAKDTGLVPLSEGVEEALAQLEAAPKDIVGLPTGFPYYDQAIGGGLRPGSISVIGARPKQGKSMLCLCMARNMAKAGIPVLYLDTELTRHYQMTRLAAMMSSIDLSVIESGGFAGDFNAKQALMSVVPDMKALPITHCSIAGESIKNVLSIVRRWLVRTVGFDSTGHAKPCVVIYDYCKLMDAGDLKSNLAEHQLLGFLLTQMHNFALRYGIPFLTTVQLNRDGIEKEGGQAISGSDRILWLCGSFAIFKRKTQEDLNEDPPQNGQRKLVVTETRFGPGLEPGEYINVVAEMERSQLTEGLRFSQSLQGLPVNTQET